MKKILLIAAAAALSFSCSTQKEEIKVSLENLGNQQVFIKYTDMSGEGTTQQDTVTAVDGTFVYDLPDTATYMVTMYPESSLINLDKKSVSQAGTINIYVKPNERINIKGKVDGKVIQYTAKGSKINQDLSAHRTTYLPMLAEMSDIMVVVDSMSTAGVERDSIMLVYNSMTEISKNVNQEKINFIKNNLDNETSGIYLMGLGMDDFYELQPQVAPTVLEGIAKNGIEKTQKRYDRNKAIQLAKEQVVAGAPAPDFTLTDLSGNPFTLSSLRGKYVVLDFWGKWCIWCVRGIPEMKATYQKVKSKFEFVGVDCGDTEEVWKAAVAEYELPWINVYNGKEENDVTVKYGVNGFPTKIIIDPQGNIAAVVVGESPEFYEKINELYKKK